MLGENISKFVTTIHTTKKLKVLIVTYYWPPAGGSGVQRWLKFVKYLRNFNIEPVVYTVKNPNYPVADTSLVQEIPAGIEILKQPIFEPNNMRSIFGKKEKQSAGFFNKKPSFFGKVVRYIRGNYFIPDARKFWVKPSVKYLKTYLLNNKIDLVITTGPPHSVHLIGLQLKEKCHVKWLADFRDPMAGVYYHNDLLLSEKTQHKLEKLEATILKTADQVVVVGNSMKTAFEKITDNIEVISNGFDDDNTPPPQKVVLDTKFTLAHIGLLPHQSNPTTLWEVLGDLVAEDENFAADLQIHFIGKTAHNVFDDITKYGLYKQVLVTKYVAHDRVLLYQQKSQVLLLLIPQVKDAAAIITGKVFEYLKSNRPILALAPIPSDVQEIIDKTRTGTVVDFNDKASLKNVILAMYANYKSGNLQVVSKNIEQYHRKKLTQKLSEVIKNLKEKQ